MEVSVPNRASSPQDEISVETDFDTPTSRQLVSSLPFSATCIRISRDSYPNLRSMSVASLPDEASSCKIVEGEFGYVLEDVPHLTDYLPDLPTFPNPLQNHPAYKTVKQYWVDSEDTIPQKIVVGKDSPRGVHFRRAGPRQKVYFESDEVIAAIVTCGGLCPGLNTVIRELVCGLSHMYNVNRILGIHGGYKGFYSSNTIELTPKSVNDIHKRGGTVLGTSRGGHDTIKIVDYIQDRGINQVYIIGGDGTQKGASEIYKEIRRRGLQVAVCGIPKTIDNDIAVIDKSFGFDTAVEEAQRAINAAHVEAESAENGIGLVKLMGRYSGFIAMYATLASRDVDCCLIPESPFYLEGKGGLFEFMEKRLKEYGHMVIVVAEGAGQKLIQQSMHSMGTQDASGNRLLLDVGLWLSHKIKEHFLERGRMTINLKYIDPTYMIRAIPSNASDNVYCTLLAQCAVHGAMAGYTGFTTGLVNGRHTYIPFHRVTSKRNRVSVTDRMWARLLSSTNQPSWLSTKDLEEHKESLDKLPKPPSMPNCSHPKTNKSSSSELINALQHVQSESSLPPISPKRATPSPRPPPPPAAKITEESSENAPKELPTVTAMAIEIKSSDTDHPPSHDSESDTQSEGSEKSKPVKQETVKVKPDNVSSSSASRPRSLLSFGRHAQIDKGWVESQSSIFSPVSRPCTAEKQSPSAQGKSVDSKEKVKELAARRSWR